MTTIASPNTLAQRKYRNKPGNREKIAARRNRKQEYERLVERRNDPAQWLQQRLPNLRDRAKKYGFECTLEAGDFVVPEVCPVLGIPLYCGTGLRLNPNSPSIDRFDNTKGYTKENCRVISTRANLLKKDATVEEIRALLKYMEGG